MSLFNRLKNAFNAFNNRDEPKSFYSKDYGMASSYQPYRSRLRYGNERTIISAIYNRLSVDCSQIKMEVVRVDDEDRYIETDINSGLNNCLTVEANKDQTARAFKEDIFLSLIDEGVIAVCPIDTDINPEKSDGYDILTMRVGKIISWYPDHVRVEVYDDRDGVKKQLLFRKDKVAIIENPFFNIMNEPNSTFKRLVQKLTMMDIVDEQTSTGKLDIIIQLPYVIKSEARKAQAEQRRTEIEQQLAGSKYGIAYTDGTEHITQLNRPAESNLLSQIEYLTKLLFSQLGITQEILEGTASEAVMNNYYERTIEPILAAVTEEFTRKFLSKTSRTQGKRVKTFNDPFRFVPTSKLPELADKMIRNEILTSNEMRAIIGYKPSSDPNADKLNNPNINNGNSETDEFFDDVEEATNENEEGNIEDIGIEGEDLLNELNSSEEYQDGS